MTPDRAPWLLQHPLDSADGAPGVDYVGHLAQPDGAILTAILAVDR
jgi:hypothetical protein